MAITRRRTGPVDPGAKRGNSKLEEKTGARLPLIRETSITARLTDAKELARRYADREYDSRTET